MCFHFGLFLSGGILGLYLICADDIDVVDYFYNMAMGEIHIQQFFCETVTGSWESHFRGETTKCYWCVRPYKHFVHIRLAFCVETMNEMDTEMVVLQCYPSLSILCYRYYCTNRIKNGTCTVL